MTATATDLFFASVNTVTESVALEETFFVLQWSFTPLHMAARANHVEVVKTLLGYGAFLDLATKVGKVLF